MYFHFSSIGHLSSRWWPFEICSPMHVSAWGCTISLRRGGSCRERTRRCVTLALPPRRAAHLRCCAQVFSGSAAPPPHSPNLRALVCAARCAAPPDALLAALCYHKALLHVGGVPAARLCAPDGSRQKSRPASAPSPPTAPTEQQRMV